MAFLDILFPPTINQGASGGPGYVTRITPKDGGDEAVDQRWATHLGRWDVSKGLQTQLQLDELQVFHIVAKGRANSFRFKDFKDFEVGVTAFKTGRLGTSAVGTGFPTYQLVKRYVNAAGSEDKTIYLPTNNAAFVVKRNGSPVTVGGGADFDQLLHRRGHFRRRFVESDHRHHEGEPGECNLRRARLLDRHAHPHFRRRRDDAGE